MEQRLDTANECDVLVIGAGAGGMATAITAAKAGLEVIIVEKAEVFGGTTAFSGGVLWIPGNRHCPPGDRERAREYLRHEAGNAFDAEAVDAYLAAGPEMVDFFERETRVAFVATQYPDYHPDAPGGAQVGRSILAEPFDSRELGKDLGRLRPPLSTITFMGMMFNSSNADLKHFFRATKSARSFVYVMKRLAAHGVEMMRFGRGTQVTSGNALAARLARSCLDLGIPIRTGCAAETLLFGNERIVGAQVTGPDGPATITARRGVVLAAGGFAQNQTMIREAYPHLQRGGSHLSPVPRDNTGDGIELGRTAGARFDLRFRSASAWMPVSAVKGRGGKVTAFPHLLDRYKPGVIAVLRNGQRFTNESESYHDVGEAMIEACKDQDETACWLIADRRTIRKYGLGFAKPAPMPLGPHIRSGYLVKGRSLDELAQNAGIDAEQLKNTVEIYNRGAVRGEDRQFGRGTTAFNRYLADPDVQPNPCVAPVKDGPFYALKLIMGDLGTFEGLETTIEGQVLSQEGAPIGGLYAVGNDRASIMAGTYPGAGITLGPAMTFGYLTGKHLAKAG